jgi:hypothetical protein
MNPKRDLSSHCEREATEIPSEKYEVGYGRPPKQTRWKKGQSGNPRRVRKRTSKPVILMIEDFFAGEIEIIENGVSRRVTNFEAILLQLCNKAMDGNKRAISVLLKYQEFAASRGDMGGLEIVEERFEYVTREEFLRGKND